MRHTFTFDIETELEYPCTIRSRTYIRLRDHEKGFGSGQQYSRTPRSSDFYLFDGLGKNSPSRVQQSAPDPGPQADQR